MKKILFIIPISVMLSCGSTPEPDNPEANVFTSNELALGGYDPVAYFEQGEPRLGKEIEQVEYAGNLYAFNSTKNRKLFEENPTKYLPEYGGWCAYAVAENATRMSPDPLQWQIQDGKLLLFTSNFMTSLTGDLKDDWNEAPKEYKEKGDTNWGHMAGE